MIKLLAYLLWWSIWLEHWMESIVANTSKEVLQHIDHYLLPILKNPFIAAEPKPPTVAF